MLFGRVFGPRGGVGVACAPAAANDATPIRTLASVQCLLGRWRGVTDHRSQMIELLLHLCDACKLNVQIASRLSELLEDLVDQCAEAAMPAAFALGSPRTGIGGT